MLTVGSQLVYVHRSLSDSSRSSSGLDFAQGNTDGRFKGGMCSADWQQQLVAHPAWLQVQTGKSMMAWMSWLISQGVGCADVAGRSVDPRTRYAQAGAEEPGAKEVTLVTSDVLRHRARDNPPCQPHKRKRPRETQG